MQIRDHHRRAIDRLGDAYRDDPRYRGLIIGGSVAKGCARDDSDVDFLIIATDEVFDQRLGARDLRQLFLYHKWFPRALESVAEKPDDLMTCFNALLTDPSGDHANALFERVKAFRDWGVTDLEAYTFPMTDVEWSWMSGSTPMEDW